MSSDGTSSGCRLSPSNTPRFLSTPSFQSGAKSVSIMTQGMDSTSLASTLASTPREPAPLGAARTLSLSPRIESTLKAPELHISGEQPFDPTEPALRDEVLQILGVEAQATVEKMPGFQGGLNDGIWFLRSSNEDLVLKLVRATPTHPGLPTEAETLLKLQRDFPAIASDRALAFPQKIVRVQAGGFHQHDLIVMRRAPGVVLGNLIQDKWRAGRASELWPILEKVGICVGDFHRRYGGKQHSDLQLSNILVDEAHGHITLVDVGGMGGAETRDADVEHFTNALRLLAGFLGPPLESQGILSFQLGYARARGR